MSFSSWGYERGQSGLDCSLYRFMVMNPQYNPWAKTDKAQKTDRVMNKAPRWLIAIAPADAAAAMSRYPPVK
jgi:hypothetical protein